MPVIEYYYSAHSAYAYIGSVKLFEICATHECTLRHFPITLSPVVEASGSLPFAKRSEGHDAYYFGREIERWADFRNVPIAGFRPTHHDNSLDLSNGMLIAAIQQGADVDRLSHRILEAHWRDDIDLANPDDLARTAHSVGIDPTPLLEAALSDEVQAIHAQNTQSAIEQNVFGSPTYILDGDMYYGQDHLELLERALITPYPEPYYTQ